MEAAAHLEFLAFLERTNDLTRPVRAFGLGSRGEAFVKLGWLRPAHQYLTHLMVPFLDGETEVVLEIDEEAGVYRYQSPQWRSRILTRPLAEIALHDIRIDAWLHDMATLLGLDHPAVGLQECISCHLWYLGGTSQSIPVFIARRLLDVSSDALESAVSDPKWGGRGMVLVHERPATLSPGVREVRAMSEFVHRQQDGLRFDHAAFDRALRALVAPSRMPEREQYFEGEVLKLPHFVQEIRLSPERAKVIHEMWGRDGTLPPLKTWNEVNLRANTGYSSFADAFEWNGLSWKDFFDREAHGKYRLRRNP